MNNIKTFEDACNKLGIDPAEFHVSYPEKLGDQYGKSMAAHAKLTVITLALNDGWEPNWGDFSEYKYYPWFEFERASDKSSGFGFSSDGWSVSRTSATVGARLCFKSKELAKYAGQQFIELYKEYFVNM